MAVRAAREEAWATVAGTDHLNSLKAGVLKAAAQRCKVDGAAKMKKSELVAALEVLKQSGQPLPDPESDGDDEEALDDGENEDGGRLESEMMQ